MPRQRILPKPGQRVIKINWAKSVKNPDVEGVYRIWFGDKFYIGRSRKIAYRKRCHEQDLIRRFQADNPIKGQFDYYQLIIAHLLKNPQISEAKMEILEVCEGDDALVAAEQKWFNKYEWDTNCLNLGLVAAPYQRERGTGLLKPKRSNIEVKKPKTKKEIKLEQDKSRLKYVKDRCKGKGGLLKMLLKGDRNRTSPLIKRLKAEVKKLSKEITTIEQRLNAKKQ